MIRIPHLACAVLAIGLVTVTTGSAYATAQNLLSGSLTTSQEPAPQADPLGQEEIAKRLAGLAAERAALLGGDTPAGQAEGVIERLDHIELQLEAQANLAQSLARPAPAESGSSAAKDPSAYQLNALYEALDAAESARREKRNHLDAATQQLNKLEARLREAKTNLQNSPADDRTQHERNVQLAELNARLAREQVNLARLELRLAQRTAVTDDLLRDRIEAVRKELARGAGDANSAARSLQERAGSLQRAKSAAEGLLATAELRLEAARQRYADNPQSAAGMLDVVEALTAYREVIGKQISLHTSELERLQPLGEVWQLWDALLRADHTPQELDTWDQRAASLLGEMDLTASLRRGQLSDLQIRRDSQQARVNQLAENAPARVPLRETGEALAALGADLFASERQLAADRRMVERFLADVRAASGNVGLLEYLSRAARFARDMWTYEITTIDDAPFTVGSLTMGLLLFAVGLWASRRGAGTVGRLAERRLKLDAGAAQAIQTFAFYALLAGFTLLALRTVHFPLTAFAFLGGALAIGVGFGSQNVMNNFISGLILMLERPVRAQDVVEVDGSHGVIQKIGPRSTQISSTDGRHIVVPNSFFLESNVVNWTLSDDIMRSKVTVGVAYGSPTRLVKQLIEEILRDEPLALNEPPATVIFEAFGDNSLNFDAYFWVRARSPMKMREAQSKVRFAIDDQFREHGIVIAFPQRDVHLDSLSPLQVQVIDKAETS